MIEDTTNTLVKETPKEYELSVLMNVAETFNEISAILKKHGAEIVKQSQFNEIRLAYPIKKKTSAFFGFCYFNVMPSQLHAIKSELFLVTALIRHLIVLPLLKIAPQPVHTSNGPVKPSEVRVAKVQPVALSNEALEQKLEEILK